LGIVHPSYRFQGVGLPIFGRRRFRCCFRTITLLRICTSWTHKSHNLGHINTYIDRRSDSRSLSAPGELRDEFSLHCQNGQSESTFALATHQFDTNLFRLPPPNEHNFKKSQAPTTHSSPTLLSFLSNFLQPQRVRRYHSN
jgi:hypothetical protein